MSTYIEHEGEIQSPVTVTELKDFLKIDQELEGSPGEGPEDQLLADLLEAATSVIEQYTGKVLITRELTRHYDVLSSLSLYLTQPVQEIKSVKCGEDDIAYSNLKLVGKVKLEEQPTGPILTVAYDAGYGTEPSSVPPKLKQAVKQLAAYYYENRENVGAVPQDILNTVYSYRVITV